MTKKKKNQLIKHNEHKQEKVHTESSSVKPLLQELESEANFGKFLCSRTCLLPENESI